MIFALIKVCFFFFFVETLVELGSEQQPDNSLRTITISLLMAVVTPAVITDAVPPAQTFPLSLWIAINWPCRL